MFMSSQVVLNSNHGIVADETAIAYSLIASIVVLVTISMSKKEFDL
jgi:hypothetical protein